MEDQGRERGPTRRIRERTRRSRERGPTRTRTRENMWFPFVALLLPAFEVAGE